MTTEVLLNEMIYRIPSKNFLVIIKKDLTNCKSIIQKCKQ